LKQPEHPASAAASCPPIEIALFSIRHAGNGRFAPGAAIRAGAILQNSLTDKLLLETLSVRGRLHFRNFIISKRLSRSRRLAVHIISVYDFGPASISHYIGELKRRKTLACVFPLRDKNGSLPMCGGHQGR
jgi:hypothetical protein